MPFDNSLQLTEISIKIDPTLDTFSLTKSHTIHSYYIVIHTSCELNASVAI